MYGTEGGGSVVFYYANDADRKAQAERLYNQIVSRTGLIGNRAETVIKKNFYVLKNTNMPAFLVENGFMDSPEDVPIILSREHAEKTAQNEKVELQELLYPAYTDESTTLSIALQTLGINYGYAFRKKAASNNIVNYRGTATQNIQMYNLLVAGLLKKA